MWYSDKRPAHTYRPKNSIETDTVSINTNKVCKLTCSSLFGASANKNKASLLINFHLQ